MEKCFRQVGMRWGLARVLVVAACLTGPLCGATKPSRLAPHFDAEAICNPATQDVVGPDSAGSAVVRAQILLDRNHFSPAEIDGYYGDNLRVAINGYQFNRKLTQTGLVDAETWQMLNADTQPVLVPYTITAADL